MTPDDDLRRRDPDRWLSSRFVADATARERLTALYLLDGEWARIGAAVTNPLAGEIRLAWWAEAVERFAGGGAADHPALDHLGREAVRRLEPALQSVIEARRWALTGGVADGAAEIALMAAATRLLDPNAPPQASEDAARVWATRRLDDLPAANTALSHLSVVAFPAVAHVTLVRVYAHNRTPGELERRARIAWAVARGRL